MERFLALFLTYGLFFLALTMSRDGLQIAKTPSTFSMIAKNDLIVYTLLLNYNIGIFLPINLWQLGMVYKPSLGAFTKFQ